MKLKLLRLMGALLFLMTQIAFAQTKTVTGTIQDANGIPLPGVNIVIKNTDTGTQSDFDGNYSISATTGETLVFSYLGFVTQEIAITASTSTIDLTMEESAAELDQVIVTALGIKKEKKALGYAVTALEADDLQQRATGDITKILRGKAAGVDVINASGLSGAGSSITIRGLSTTGDNQPLYVVDGVRFNSNTNGTGFSGTSRSLDIDPNNIESVNVLRGLNAATLYGADGKNGVIVITTKAGKVGGNFNKKQEISVTVSTFVNDIASLPDYTNQRGQGYYDAFYNFFGNWGATFGRPGIGNVNSDGQVPHPYALNSPVFLDGFPDQADDLVDYRDYESQVNFFETGIVKNINVSMNGGTENLGYNVSYSNLDDEGFLPGNKLDRDAISLGGNAKLSNNFTISSTLNYANTNFRSPFTGPIFTGLLNTPKSIDLAGFPSQHPITGEEINFQNDSDASNPYWFLNNSGIREEVNRVYGQLSATYNISDNFNVTYRYGIDTSIEQRNVFVNRGSTGGAEVTGALTTSSRRQTVTNHTLLFNYDNRFFDDKFGLSANFGGDVFREENVLEGANSTQQTVFGQFNHDFFSASQGFNFTSVRNRPGVLAQATFDLDNYLFLTGNARYDYTSNFKNNDLFYPGVGVSFLPTAAFEGLKSDALTYLKLRAGYGSSAEFSVPGGDAYPTSQTIASNANSFVTANGEVIATDAISNTLANEDIGPSLIEEFEFGIESKFFNNRITLDASYYTRTTSDLIFFTNFDPATGFTGGTQNINEFQSDGIELNLNVSLFKNENFSWDIGGNFTATESEVTELDVDQFQYASATAGGQLGNYLIEGEPVGIILGSVVQRDDNGNLINNGREYTFDPDPAIIGDPTPDWTASGFTAISYKNITLTANLQYRKGGDVFSSTALSLLGRGLTTDTDGLQNAGFILPGINSDTEMENDVVISTGDAYFNLYNNGPDEFGIFDGTTIRLQEIALTYRLSEKALERTPFGSMSFSLVGENLYFKAINIPDGLNIDTNSIGTGVNSNGSGIELGVSPSSRRIGLSIKTSF